MGVEGYAMSGFGGDEGVCLDGRRVCRVRCDERWGCEVDGFGSRCGWWWVFPIGPFGGEGLVALPEEIFILDLVGFQFEYLGEIAGDFGVENLVARLSRSKNKKARLALRTGRI